MKTVWIIYLVTPKFFKINRYLLLLKEYYCLIKKGKSMTLSHYLFDVIGVI